MLRWFDRDDVTLFWLELFEFLFCFFDEFFFFVFDLREYVSELIESGCFIELEIEKFEACPYEMSDDISDDDDADESEEGSLRRWSI